MSKALSGQKGVSEEMREKIQKLADELGVTLSTIGRIESGIKMASIDLLVDMSVYFDASLDYIIMGKE